MPGVAKLIAYGVGVPAGLYVASVGYDVYSKQREEQEIAARMIAELTAAKTAQVAEKREEAAIRGLEQSVQQNQQGVQEVEAEISRVQAKLSELEEVRAARAKQAADAAAALDESRGKLARLVQEARLHREAATAAEAALEAARHETRAAKALFNPLHHPLVRSFRSGH